MTHDNHEAWVHATACGVPVPQLLELAVDGKLELAVRQCGWRALSGFMYDLGGGRGPEFEPDGDVPYELPVGHLVGLQLSDVDRLRGHRTIEVMRVFNADSLVQLLSAQTVTWAMLRVDPSAIPEDMLAAVAQDDTGPEQSQQLARDTALASPHDELSTRQAARYLRIRNTTLAAATDAAAAAGFAHRKGSGTERKAYRWKRSGLKEWWKRHHESATQPGRA